MIRCGQDCSGDCPPARGGALSLQRGRSAAFSRGPAMEGEHASAMAERLKLLTQTGPDTDMGRLLRKFWLPVAVSHGVKPGTARPLRAMGEDLTLYRGESGQAHLVSGRCAHRRTVLHTGWVQGEEIRCIYHGWKYAGSGQCTEAPAEGADSAARIKIAGYPVHEYCGLIFAYLGGGVAPAFDLPRKEAFEKAGLIVFSRIQIWPCNWFETIENSLDAVHVTFVHRKGKVRPIGEAVTAAIPKLDYVETDAGIRQVATRSSTNVR